jgi:enoyl-CoA hydratase/carnithine racemase
MSQIYGLSTVYSQSLEDQWRHPALHGAGCERAQKIALLDMGVPVNPSVAHAELIATFKRAEADAAHKFGLIKAAAQKGPKAVQAAAETAAKAAKRRDSYAKKLDSLGVCLKD